MPNDSVEQSPAVAEPAIKREVKPAPHRKLDELPPYHVVLLDDDEHTHDYVVDMLSKVFGHAEEIAFILAKEVDLSGRVIVLTTHKEKAELKRDQIHSFGRDQRIVRCKGSMQAVIEPAEG